jgi:hypothetical protein
MRCYCVKVPGCVRLAATGSEARAYRQAFVDERGVMKKKVDISQVDLKTSKPDLLAFLNVLLEQQDDNKDFVLPGIEGVEGEDGDEEE